VPKNGENVISKKNIFVKIDLIFNIIHVPVKNFVERKKLPKYNVII